MAIRSTRDSKHSMGKVSARRDIETDRPSEVLHPKDAPEDKPRAAIEAPLPERKKDESFDRTIELLRSQPKDADRLIEKLHRFVEEHKGKKKKSYGGQPTGSSGEDDEEE